MQGSVRTKHNRTDEEMKWNVFGGNVTRLHRAVGKALINIDQ